MKKLFISAGLVALGAAGLQTAMAGDIASPNLWNVGATLRGFYDDNYNISGNGKGSFGAEVLPSVSFHEPLQQTDMGIRYTYGLYYYQDRQDMGLDAFDQTHQVDLWLDHAINERWHAKLTDTFAAGQEPELLSPNPVIGNPIPYRLNGDNISNHGTIVLSTDWTRQFSTALNYNNNFYNYDNQGTTVASLQNGSGASLAAILNRIEQGVSLDFKWHIQPETTAFIGYEFSWVNYTGNEPIAIYTPVYTPVPTIYKSSARDSRTQYGYLGVEHQFTANLTGTVRGGASYTDNYADPLYPSTSWAPYADLSISYTYIPGSYVQLGVTQDISASDRVQPDSSGHLTQYQKNTVVYVDVNHKITQKLTGTVIGRMQYNTYEGGAAGSLDQTDYSVGVNLNYRISQHFSADAGYNYDDVVSQVGGGYDRNRVYLGLSANY